MGFSWVTLAIIYPMKPNIGTQGMHAELFFGEFKALGGSNTHWTLNS